MKKKRNEMDEIRNPKEHIVKDVIVYISFHFDSFLFYLV